VLGQSTHIFKEADGYYALSFKLSVLAMTHLLNLVLLLTSIGVVIAADLCPIYGPVFPPSKDLSASLTWHDAASKIKAALDDAFASGNTSHGPVSSNDTYSVQIFSKQDTLFEYYNDGSSLAASGGCGSELDGNSVYRVGSISKLYAVYLLLVVAGDRVFSDPVVKYLPDLKDVAYWDEVTVGALAGQVGGVVADRKCQLRSFICPISD
jgi:CubicO group peptidase (beta-lactamase class C family)